MASYAEPGDEQGVPAAGTVNLTPYTFAGTVPLPAELLADSFLNVRQVMMDRLISGTPNPSATTYTPTPPAESTEPEPCDHCGLVEFLTQFRGTRGSDGAMLCDECFGTATMEE